MASLATVLVLTFGWVATLYVGQRYYHNAKNRHSLPLPPGPPGLPWIGTVIGVDVSAPWITYRKWSKKYGDLIHTRVLGKDIIVISSEKIAKDLLENRSRIYSDRPHLITNELCGIAFNSAMLHYGDRWRLHRRFFHQIFRAEAVSSHLPVLDSKTNRLLRRMLDGPEQLSDHVFEYTTSVILNSVYNYDPTSRKDELTEIAAKVLDIATTVVSPNLAILISAVPAILSLPSWFPGMSFKDKMADVKECSNQYLEKPFAYCLRNMSSDRNIPSMIHTALRSMEEKGTPPDESWMNALKGASATAFLAASETTNTILMIFFFYVMANPTVQEKAQAQIDTVVGKTRLPTIDDRPSLPYIDAIFREVLRLGTPTPLSIPHATVSDDVYAGYHIPKGTIVMVNLWSMMRDESRYPNPHAFLPERFLNRDGSLKPKDVENMVYGFGRRICVGRHFADTSVWSVMAKVLAVFRILKPLDKNGVEMPVELKLAGVASVHPLPFQYRIVPRIPGLSTKQLEDLIAKTPAQE